jgi:glycosyltransferase involved in cell wall biosynthesis
MQASQFKDYEIIVVDDASTDGTPGVAIELGIHPYLISCQSGPAAARNHGAKNARGEFLFFIDADVCVSPETLGQVVETFSRDPAVDAVFGSYDLQPRAPNFLSQYKNLFHHFVHQEGLEQAATFWSGCGAIRRSVFETMGGFNISYERPCIEDIELGMRLHRAGRKIVLNKQIQVTHLKQWTLWGLLKSDVWDRGVPWTQLILREQNLPNDLNLKISHRVCVVLTYGLLVALAAGAWYFHGLLLLPVIGLLGIVVVDYWSVKKKAPTTMKVLTVLMLLGALVAMSYYFKLWLLLALAFLLGIVLINLRFYIFFMRERGPFFALFVVPLHIFYYLYSGLAFAIGAWLHFWKAKFPLSRG